MLALLLDIRYILRVVVDKLILNYEFLTRIYKKESYSNTQHKKRLSLELVLVA